MRGRAPQHPWADLAPEELLNIAGFVRKDVFNGKIGYTLAAALMFGSDEIIQSVAPAYKFDAIVPYTWLSGSAEAAGQPIERNVSGLADSLY